MLVLIVARECAACTMNHRLVFSALVVCILSPLCAQDYDLVIKNGRVIDPETKFDEVANVGIKGGRIARISTEALAAKEAIEAEGLVVAPGWIDLHAHGMALGDMRMQAMQGVTTLLELESGLLPIADWYEQKEKDHTPLNYGAATMDKGPPIAF